MGFEQHLGPSLVFPKLLFVSSTFKKHRKIEVLVTEACGKKCLDPFPTPSSATPQARAPGIDFELLNDMLKVGDAQTDIPTLQLPKEACLV